MQISERQKETHKLTLSYAICSTCKAQCELNSNTVLRNFRTSEEAAKWITHLKSIEILDAAEMPNQGLVFLPKYRFNSSTVFGCVIGIAGKSFDEVEFTVWTKGDYDEEFARKSICRRIGFDYPYTVEYAAPRYSTFLHQLETPILGFANWAAPLQIAIWYSFARQIEVERELRAFFEFLYGYGERIEPNIQLTLHKHAIGELSNDINYSTQIDLVWYDLPEEIEVIHEFRRFQELVNRPKQEMKNKIRRIFKMEQRVDAFCSMFGETDVLHKMATFARTEHDRSSIVQRLKTFKEENNLEGWGLKTLCCVLQQAFRNPLAYPIDSLIRRVSQTAFGMKGDDTQIWRQALQSFSYPALVEPVLYENAQERLLICGEDGEKGCDICSLRIKGCPRHEPNP